MKRLSLVVLAVVAAQAALYGLYRLVERGRAAEVAQQIYLGTGPPQRVDLVIPQLTLRAHDGRGVDLRALPQPTLVHFWATWCPPCRVELPGLLALPDAHPVQVMAVALDEDWAAVEAFGGRLVQQLVVLGEAAEVEGALGVHTLPVTLLVQPGGRISHRFDGARDWTDRGFLRTWLVEPARQGAADAPRP